MSGPGEGFGMGPVAQKRRQISKIRVTSPKGVKPSFFVFFFDVFEARDPFQRLLQALGSNFPSKMLDLDAYVSSYVTFRRFCRVWNPFFKYLAASAAKYREKGCRYFRFFILLRRPGPGPGARGLRRRMKNRVFF